MRCDAKVLSIGIINEININGMVVQWRCGRTPIETALYNVSSNH